jgi:dephospho-CoA kinase
LLFKKKITSVEAENIDINKILNFTKSNLWQEVKKAKLVKREKTFYITIPVDEIYESNIKEEILVQGIIDLYYINENDELNRKALASIVFSDSKKLELLNTITYPYITREILKQIDSLSAQGELLILLDAPTLFESRADDFCELIISVIAHTDLRQQRIMERDSLTSEQALKRMNSQLPESFFIENSDFIIKNNKSMKNVFDISKEVSDKIKEYYYNKNSTQPEQNNSCACSE